MTMDSQSPQTQTNTDADDFVTNPGAILKETSKTLKSLLAANYNVPAELKQNTLNEIAEIEKNYDVLVDTDYDFAHENIKIVITKAMEALTSVFVIAGASDNPRAYEVAALYIKTLTDINKDLLQLHEIHANTKQARSIEKPQQGVNNNTTNNLFVGSSSELLEMIMNRTKTATQHEIP